MNRYDELIEELEYIVGRKSDDLNHLEANQEINKKEMAIYQKSIAEIDEKLDPDKISQIKKALRKGKLFRLCLGAIETVVVAVVFFQLRYFSSTFAQFCGVMASLFITAVISKEIVASKKESIELKTKQEYLDNMSEDKEFYTEERERLQGYINNKKSLIEEITTQIGQTKEECLNYEEKLDEVRELREEKISEAMESKQVLDVVTDFVNQNFATQDDLIEIEKTLKRERNK